MEAHWRMIGQRHSHVQNTRALLWTWLPLTIGRWCCKGQSDENTVSESWSSLRSFCTFSIS